MSPNEPSFLFPHTQTRVRKEACPLCRSATGNLVGLVNYIELVDLDMVQCAHCGLVSVDPIPDSAIVEEGCARLYLMQQSGETRQKLIRGFAKSFRRGARFARHYLAGRDPRVPLRLLEVGAGDGYFSAGIRGQMPHASVTLIDIVEDLVRYYRDSHRDAQCVHGEFQPGAFQPGSFDLIIFRDLLEHVRDPVKFLRAAREALAPGGQIFFITPNGREDFWTISQQYSNHQARSQLLINHFHYFLPDTLMRMLRETGFALKTGFKFGLKHHKRGLGWKKLTRFDRSEVPKTAALKALPKVSELWKHRATEVRSRHLSDLGLVSRIYSDLVDVEKPVVGLLKPEGHEFFILAERGDA